DVPLLGMPAEADWVLYAPYEDKTLIRDVLAYDLARSMGHYAPRTQFVELFIRSSQGSLSMRDYEGVYVLTEKIKRGKNRVPVAKLEAKDRTEPDISGGYILKRDHSDGPGARFRTSHGGPYFYIYPKPDKITSEQKRWIREYLQTFESTLESPEFDDPQHGYARFLDVDSFIDAHWLIELGKNVDGFRYSAFLSKDRDGKLKPEPPWDWNRSFGNANYYGGGQPRGWYWTNLRPNEINWYRRLRQDPAFARRCTARWRELRQGAFDPKRISGRIDELAAQLAGAQKRNFQRWPVLGHQVTCNYYVGDSFEAEVQWLKKWIDHRIAWIDQQVAKVSDN
ncbi:MAG: CotH kinase family protein, partial [Verrucomicrobiota bacterium]